ncbi:MAG: site-2 protease family protein [Dehalococcoidia bacterium]
MRSNLNLGSLLGIPIGLNYSWFVTLAVITVFFGVQIYPLMLPDETRAVHWMLSVLTAVLAFVSVLLHELAHALAARRAGVPVQGVTLFIFGGIARLEADARRPATEFFIALVGPLTSFVLFGLFFGFWLAAGSPDTTGGIIWEWLWLINLAVGAINLAPAFPFDGARLLRSSIWGVSGSFQRASQITATLGQAIGYALIAAGVVSLLGPDFLPFELDSLDELWLILIGLFLENSARSSYQQVRMNEVLQTQNASDAMSRNFDLVSREATVDEALQSLGEKDNAFAFVTEDSRVIGIVTAAAMKALPAAELGGKTTSEVMVPAGDVQVVHSDELLAEVVQRMDAAKVDVMPVIEDGRLAGLVSREQITALIDK